MYLQRYYFSIVNLCRVFEVLYHASELANANGVKHCTGQHREHRYR